MMYFLKQRKYGEVMQSLLSVRFGCHNLPLAARRSQLCELCVRSLTLCQLIVFVDSFWHCLFFCIVQMMQSEEVLAVLGGGGLGLTFFNRPFIFKGKHALVFKRLFGSFWCCGQIFVSVNHPTQTHAREGCGSRKREGDCKVISFLFSFCSCLRTVRLSVMLRAFVGFWEFTKL